MTTVTTYTISNSGSGAYTINGSDNAILNFYRGRSYTLNINAVGHPFWIQTTTIPYNAANVYNSGVTNNGTQNGTITFIVPYTAPDTLYYVCQYDGSMNGTINITNDPNVPVTIFKTSIQNPRDTAKYGSYLFIQKYNSIDRLNLDTNVLDSNWYTFPTAVRNLDLINQSITIGGNFLYVNVNVRNSNTHKYIIQITLDSNGNNTNLIERWHTITTDPNIDSMSLYYYVSKLYLYINTGLRTLEVDNSGNKGVFTELPVSGDGYFAINDSKIYTYEYGNSSINSYSLTGTLLTKFNIPGFNVYYRPCFYGNYLYYPKRNSGDIVQMNLTSGTVSNYSYASNLGTMMNLFIIDTNIIVLSNVIDTIYKVPLPNIATVFTPVINWSKIDMCYNTTINSVPLNSLVFQGYYSYDSTLSIRSFYSADDLTTNLLIDDSNAFLIDLKQRRNFTICNKVTSTGAIDGSRGGCYVKCLPFLKKIFVSEPYLILSGSSISIYDNYGNLTDATATSYVPGSLWGREANGNVYADKNGNFSVGGGWTSRYTTVSMPTVNEAPVSVDDSFFGQIKYLDFTVKYNNNTVLKSYFVYKLDQNNKSYLCAVYLYSSVKNILLGGDANRINDFYTDKNFYGGSGLIISSIPSLDAQYASVRNYAINYAIDQLAIGVTAFDANGNSMSTINFNGTNLASVRMIGTTEILDSQPPPPPPPIQYARMRINYNSVVNGNPVGGTVFDGYYSYQTTDNKVVSLYSSSDLTTNLIIPSTDPFITGALTLLGKTSSNTANSSGIDTTASHAGVFVKDLPFVNALFKSSPYVVLKPSGMVMFDNYGAVNENVLATSYFANKYVMSNGNVYSNKNNSFFSFSNFTFTYNTVSAIPTVNVPPAIDYTFFNSISQIIYTAKYNGAVVLDSYFVFYLDRFNNYHMCAQYVKSETKNLLVYSDESCDNFPITRDFGNSAGTQSTSSSDNTITETSGEAENATVTTFDVNETGTSTVLETINVVGETRTVNLNALNSNICFSEGSIVSTDQGEVEIQNIDIHYHTIRGNNIIALTETQSIDNYLVKIKKNAFGSVPTQDTEMTGNHIIFNGLSMVMAKTLINGTSIEKIPYRGLPLYNILLEQHNIMTVNGMITETLNPENPIAKYYTIMEKNPEKKVEMENMWRKRTQEIIHASF